MTARAVHRIIPTKPQPEGQGALVRRSIGVPALRNLSPFLMLDHATIQPTAGFPDHPHRGQETITYVLSGGIDHEDFTGAKGSLEAGDLQFMTAGRGVVHAEMPRDTKDGSPSEGIQIWVDLPKHLKDCEPRYRDLKAQEIPVAQTGDGKATVKVISGKSYGVDSVKDLAYTPVWLFDIAIRPGGAVRQALPQGWTAFAYVLDGEVEIGGRTVKRFHNAILEREGDEVDISVPADEEEAAEGGKEARVLLAAGLPLDQPIVQYGPFVMTSEEEIYKAFLDYQGYRNGFERAKGFQSEVGRRLTAA